MKNIVHKIDTSRVDNVVIGGINHKDAPDYVDAYIISADYEGDEMTDLAIDVLNNDSDFVHEEVLRTLY